MITQFLVKQKKSDDSENEEPKRQTGDKSKRDRSRKSIKEKTKFTPVKQNVISIDEASNDSIGPEFSKISPRKVSTPHKVSISKSSSAASRKRGRKSQVDDPPIIISSPTDPNKSKLNNRAVSPPLPLSTKLEITDCDKDYFKDVRKIAESKLAATVLTPLKSQNFKQDKVCSHEHYLIENV